MFVRNYQAQILPFLMEVIGTVPKIETDIDFQK
jgi:hypothetical protein